MSQKKKAKEVVHQDRVVRCKVTIQNQFFPKLPRKIEAGTFGIVTANVLWEDENYLPTQPHPTYGTITLKGDSLPALEPYSKTEYMVQAYETTSDYGLSYTIQMMTEIVDLSDEKKQRAYLRQIISERLVDALFDTFDNPIEAIKEGDREKLKQVKGLGDKNIDKLMLKVLSSEDLSEILTELEDYKLTKREIDALMLKYKNPRLVVQMVKKNPYILMDVVSRVGFLRADEVALSGGFNPKSPLRVAAYIRHYLYEQAEKGNSWILTSVLVQAIDDYFANYHLKDEVLSRALKKLIEDKFLWHSEDKTRVGLQSIYDIEYGIAVELKRLLSAKNDFEFSNWEGKIKEQEEKQGWTYTEEQREGIKTVLENNVVLVSGLAGTGKSSIIAGMLAVFDGKYSVGATALSGKASVNISETASSNGMEIEGKTIHRLLKVAGADGSFFFRKGNPLPQKIIILDEVSMVNIELMYSLVQAIKDGAKLIMLGDNGQLPSIGAGNFMTDILNSKIIPTVTLTKVHRQAAASGIISESIKIRNGISLCQSSDNKVEVRGELQDLTMDLTNDGSFVFSKVVDHFKNEWEKLDDIMDILVVLPMRERGSASVYHVNNAIQNYLFRSTLKQAYIVHPNTKSEFKLYVGDKVINNKNDYEVIGTDGKETAIFNGNLGIVTSIDFENQTITVDFNEIGEVYLESHQIQNLSLGYAISVHKSQGSGIKTIIFGMNYESYVLLSRELVYTALTRAKKKCIVVAESGALKLSSTISSIQDKQTFLPQILTSLK